jgi:ABC-type uncharacterized transport system permease subunit
MFSHGRCVHGLPLQTPTGDISMKVDRKTQIPNLVVYAAIYAIIFGISIWMLIAHKENPTNWLLYVGMIGSVFGRIGQIHCAFTKATPTICIAVIQSAKYM